ncbi:hypothetical protein [Zhaonella formicivorans]|uniref:lysine 5,6-aminomutase reactivase subunit KamB n=1 Tax=Zhaonella formicivorans TaxID=2528593 RepID=UPI0010D636DD|nr:hypothetical protein [Zhaonella formicivorans]
MHSMAIGIAGTAKNTGKTTTTSSIIDELNKKDMMFGLTSIGYDGERIDNVTGLPKPRLTLLPGQLVATAERCLKVSTARLEIIETTNMLTPLGRIVYARVKEQGQVLIAGPNKSSQLRTVIAKLQELEARLILVDGALNRMAPMVETDGFILATGAARQPDIGRLVEETGAISGVCSLGSYQGRSLQGYNSVTFVTARGKIIESPVAFLIDKQDIQELYLHWQPKTAFVYIPGVVGEKCWPELVKFLLEQDSKPALVFADPIKILISGNVTQSYQYIRTLQKHGIKVLLKQQVELLAITVNPFYPRYRYEANDYEPAYVDKQLLLQSMRENIGVPVFDVMQDGGKNLLQQILQKDRISKEGLPPFSR